MELIFFPLHMIFLAYVAWNVFQADHMGFNWIKGRTTTLDAAKVATYHRGTWTGLLLMIATGLGLFWPERAVLLANPAFFIKMFFIAGLLINGLFIGKLSKVATEHSFASLSTAQKLPLFVSGGVSTLCWAGVGITAFFLLP